MINKICYLLLVLIFLISGCSSSNDSNTNNKEYKTKEYEVINVKGIDKEIKDYFGYTIQTIENDSYDVTYLVNGKKETINLGLGEYGLHKLRVSDHNYLTIEDKGIDTYITLHISKESQEKWDVSY